MSTPQDKIKLFESQQVRAEGFNESPEVAKEGAKAARLQLEKSTDQFPHRRFVA